MNDETRNSFYSIRFHILLIWLIIGGSEGNRTPITDVTSQRPNHWTTDPIGQVLWPETLRVLSFRVGSPPWTWTTTWQLKSAAVLINTRGECLMTRVIKTAGFNHYRSNGIRSSIYPCELIGTCSFTRYQACETLSLIHDRLDFYYGWLTLLCVVRAFEQRSFIIWCSPYRHSSIASWEDRTTFSRSKLMDIL